MMFNSTNGWDAAVGIPLATRADREVAAVHLGELYVTADALAEAGRDLPEQTVDTLHNLRDCIPESPPPRMQMFLDRADRGLTDVEGSTVRIPFNEVDSVFDAAFQELSLLSYHTITRNLDAVFQLQDTAVNAEELSQDSWLWARDVFSLWMECTIGEEGWLVVQYE